MFKIKKTAERWTKNNQNSSADQQQETTQYVPLVSSSGYSDSSARQERSNQKTETQHQQTVGMQIQPIVQPLAQNITSSYPQQIYPGGRSSTAREGQHQQINVQVAPSRRVVGKGSIKAEAQHQYRVVASQDLDKICTSGRQVPDSGDFTGSILEQHRNLADDREQTTTHAIELVVTSETNIDNNTIINIDQSSAASVKSASRYPESTSAAH